MEVKDAFLQTSSTARLPVITLLDLSTAFDTIDNDILLTRHIISLSVSMALRWIVLLDEHGGRVCDAVRLGVHKRSCGLVCHRVCPGPPIRNCLFYTPLA